ncbi:MAG: hypothetical protein GX413_00125 [Acetobacter sp.]|nr:hypothetical protein [Acetobacter sp.]
MTGRCSRNDVIDNLAVLLAVLRVFRTDWSRYRNHADRLPSLAKVTGE